MGNYYATLCIKDGGGYVRIEAENFDAARSAMFGSKYGKEWAFMYDESQKAECIDAYGQNEVDHIVAA